jgi:serine/threonine protein kinase
MTLSPGARLGPYEVQAAIGAGGMGEVYKAKDTRLDRSVAIKVLTIGSISGAPGGFTPRALNIRPLIRPCGGRPRL